MQVCITKVSKSCINFLLNLRRFYVDFQISLIYISHRVQDTFESRKRRNDKYFTEDAKVLHMYNTTTKILPR